MEWERRRLAAPEQYGPGPGDTLGWASSGTPIPQRRPAPGGEGGKAQLPVGSGQRSAGVQVIYIRSWCSRRRSTTGKSQPSWPYKRGPLSCGSVQSEAAATPPRDQVRWHPLAGPVQASRSGG